MAKIKNPTIVGSVKSKYYFESDLPINRPTGSQGNNMLGITLLTESDYYIRTPNAVSMSYFLRGVNYTQPDTNITFDFSGGQMTNLGSLLGTARSTSETGAGGTLKIIGDLSHVTEYGSMALVNNGEVVEFHTFDFDFDFTSVTGDVNFSTVVAGYGRGQRVQNIRFKPNTLSVNINLLGNARLYNLTNESIVSIANGLKDEITDKTITFYATIKDKLPNIMGTISTDKGYNFFTADDSGTVSLQNFITQTKGWTVA